MMKSLNVVLFGERGVGKSSLINLMAGNKVAEISRDDNPGTLSYGPHPIRVSGVSYTIWDTRGFSKVDGALGGEDCIVAVQQAFQLIRKVKSLGGVDLLILCICEGSITTTIRSIYRLLYEVFCEAKVPIAFVVTFLERHTRMDDWWDENVASFKRDEMWTATHACVTTLPGHSKSQESKHAIEHMLSQHDDNGKYHMPPVKWFLRFSWRWFRFQNRLKGLKKGNLDAFLRKRCGFSIRDAQAIAGIVAEEENDVVEIQDPHFSLLLNSPSTSAPENGCSKPSNTLSSVAPLSNHISPSTCPQVPRVSSLGEDFLKLPPTQLNGPANTDDILSDLPNDLTGQVTQSSGRPWTSGGSGDIYRGSLNMGGRLINVRQYYFSLGKLNNH